MKQIISCILCGLFSFFFLLQSTYAQVEINKNKVKDTATLDRKFIVGGAFDLSTLGNRTIISPYIGYALNKHFTVGIEFDYSKSSLFRQIDLNESYFFNESKTARYSLFGRYIFNPDDKLSFFTQLSIGQNFANLETIFSDFNSTSFEKNSFSDNYLSSNLGFGLHYKINNRFNILLDIGAISYDFLNNEANFNLNIRSISPRLEIKF